MMAIFKILLVGACLMHFGEAKSGALSGLKSVKDWTPQLLAGNYLTSGDRLIDVAVEIAHEHKEIVNEGLTELLQHTHAYNKEVEKLARFKQFLADPSEADECQSCIDLVELLMGIADSPDVNWDDVEPIVKDICYNLTSVTNTNPAFCDIIDIQGPHVFYILENIDNGEVFCETSNRCILPRTEPLPTGRKQDGAAPKDEASQEPHTQKKKRQAQPLVIAQLTDIHIQPKYAVDSPTDCNLPVCCTNDYPGTGAARPYGEYVCNIPERTMQMFLDMVPDFQPDFIVYSGDTPPHTQWIETLTSQLNCTYILVRALTQTLPEYTIYPNLGNHDMYPTNLFYPQLTDTQSVQEAYTDMWAPLAKFGPDQISTMKYLSYYTTLHSPGLRILSINVIHNWYVFNFYAALNKGSQETQDLQNFVENTLIQARANGEKVIVITHVPTGDDGIVRSTRWWQNMAILYDDVIALHIGGHTHSDSFRLMPDGNNVSRSVMYVSPSMTTYGPANPSMRVFSLDRDTFEVLDYSNYYLDIEEETPQIKLSYAAKATYGLTDLSPASWRDLVERFKTDDELFQAWYNNFRAQSTDNAFCGRLCKARALCTMLYPNVDEVDYCVDNIEL